MYNASTTAWQWETISENIDALDFVYRDQNGNAIVISPTTLQDIRSVDITIVARTGRKDQDFTDTQAYFNQEDLVNPILAAQNDNFRRRLLTTNIACRNMGI